MTVSSIGTTNPLLSQLQANGLSASKAALVQGEMAAAAKDAKGADGGAKPDAVAVRAALDKRIAADVAAGKLSKTDAAEIKKTLDQADAQAGGAKPAGSGGAASSSRGGGGGGSAAKTELSRTVTLNGPLKSTVITYSDGTTATTNGVATSSDQQRYAKPGAASQSSAAQDYLATVPRGSLIDTAA